MPNSVEVLAEEGREGRGKGERHKREEGEGTPSRGARQWLCRARRWPSYPILPLGERSFAQRPHSRGSASPSRCHSRADVSRYM